MKFRSFFTENDLPGGAGDNLSAQDVDQAELQKGIKHEMEHTKDEALAKEIALDHLAENPHYYSDMEKYMPEPGKEPQISMPVGGVGKSPVGGIVMPQAFAISVKTGGDGSSFSGDKGDGEEKPGLSGPAPDGIEQPGDKEPITAAGKTDVSFAEKTVGGPAAEGEGQKQGGPNTQGCIADTPENSDIEGSEAPGGTPKNTAIMGGSYEESKGSEESEESEGEEEKEEGGEENKAPWMKDKEEKGEEEGDDDDEKDKVNELKSIIKSEIKSVLKEMWMGWQDDENVQESEKWIQKAIKRPGALKAKDPTPSTPLTGKDLDKLEKGGDTRTKKQVNLARTLKKMHKEGVINLKEMTAESVQKMMTEKAPPGFPEDLAQKLGKQYGKDSPKKFATMWKIHNKGWVEEITRRVAESKKK